MTSDDDDESALDDPGVMRALALLQMRKLQDAQCQCAIGKTFEVKIEYEGNNCLKLQWRSMYADSRQNFDVKVTRVEGLLDVTDFHGEETLIEMRGNGAIVDKEVVEGQTYLYHFYFEGSEIPDTKFEDYVIPYIVPMSQEKRERFARFEESIDQPPAAIARQAMEEFEELEETMEELKRATVAKMATKYKGEELRQRTVRFTAFYSQLRQRFH